MPVASSGLAPRARPWKGCLRVCMTDVPMLRVARAGVHGKNMEVVRIADRTRVALHPGNYLTISDLDRVKAPKKTKCAFGLVAFGGGQSQIYRYLKY